MTSTKLIARVAAVIAAAYLLVLVAPEAFGDQQVTAVVSDKYGTPTVTMAQGERVTFSNQDLVDVHNVTANANDAQGNPLFSSQTIAPGQTATVDGTQYLTTGSYTFYCAVHPFMQGTLVVTSAGTPLPRPTTPTGGGTRPGHGHKVTLKNIRFQPPTTRIHVGESVQWVWRDGSIPHNVTSRGFRSSSTKTHGTYTVTFKKPGTYRYHCTIHPRMQGKIIVTRRKKP